MSDEENGRTADGEGEVGDDDGDVVGNQSPIATAEEKSDSDEDENKIQQTSKGEESGESDSQIDAKPSVLVSAMDLSMEEKEEASKNSGSEQGNDVARERVVTINPWQGGK